MRLESGSDAAWKRAVGAGATVVMPLDDMFWGDRTGRLEDPFGHQWELTQTVRDVEPAEWGGEGSW